jgi:hypothetical protein
VIILSSLLLSASLHRPPCAVSPESAAGARSTENRWVEALEAKDANQLECILAPEFTDTNWRGSLLTRSQVLGALATRPASELRLSNVRVQLFGNVALVSGVNTQKAGPKIVGSVRFTDVFVYRMSRWMAVSAHETLISSR